jgi:radical SAM superfamily enzyme YgiQ (UPF0313 family)
MLQKSESGNWTSQAEAIFSQARGIGLATVAIFSLGTPSESREDVRKSVSLARRLKPDILQICFFTPYPGSLVYEKYKDGIPPESLEKMYHYSVPLSDFSDIPKDALGGIYREFYRDILLKPGFLIRHFHRYALYYFFNRKVFLKLFSMRKLIFGESAAP